MFCKNCGKQIDEIVKFCPYCGDQAIKVPGSKEEISQKSEIKTYSSIFWKYFGILFLLSISSGILDVISADFLWVIYFTIVILYIYYFCTMINEAMLSVGKKNWWPLGLLSSIPFGFWVVFFIVRAQLKPRGRWSLGKEKMSLLAILLIIFLIIAIIGILASIVLVSLSGARERARDAQRQSDIRQMTSAMEIYYEQNKTYFSSISVSKRIPKISYKKLEK